MRVPVKEHTKQVVFKGLLHFIARSVIQSVVYEDSVCA